MLLTINLILILPWFIVLQKYNLENVYFYTVEIRLFASTTVLINYNNNLNNNKYYYYYC